MRKQFSFLLVALSLLIVLSSPLSMTGQTKSSETYVWIASQQGYGYAQTVGQFQISPNVQGLLAKGKGNNPPKYYPASNGVRMYAKNVLTITPAKGTYLTRVEYHYAKQGTNAYAEISLTSGPVGSIYEHGEVPTEPNVESVDTWIYNEGTSDAVAVTLGDSGQRVLLSITVTALVSSIGVTHTLTYHNGLSGELADSLSYELPEGSLVTVEECAFLYNNHAFVNWNTEIDGSGTSYFPGNTFYLNENKTLYAQWYDLTYGLMTVLTPTNVNAGMSPTGSGYQVWTADCTQGSYTISYMGKSYRSNEFIQINKSTSGSSAYSGIVTTASQGWASQVEVVWNSLTEYDRTLEIYGSNRPYDTLTDLYNSNQGQLIGTITNDGSVNGVFNFSDEQTFPYIGLRSAGGAMYFNEIRITWHFAVDAPTIHFTPSTIDLGNIGSGEEATTTFYVSQANLHADVTLSAPDGVALSPSTIPQGDGITQVTWTYTPNAAGLLNQTITATSTWMEGGEPHSIAAYMYIHALVIDPTAGDSLWVKKRDYLRNPSNNQVSINLAKGVEVIGQDGYYLYLQDDKAGILVYGSGAPEFQKGDVITAGSLTGTFTNYHGIIEITNFTFLGVQKQEGDRLTPVAVSSVSTLLNDTNHTYEHRYVQLNGTLTFANYVATLHGDVNLPMEDRFGIGYGYCTPPETIDPFTVKGLFNPRWSNETLNKALNPTAMSDIHTSRKATHPSFNPTNPSTDQNNPTATTFFTIYPASNTRVVYEINRDDPFEISVPVTINIDGTMNVVVHAERDFYENSDDVWYYFTLSAGTQSVAFSINGVVNPDHTVNITSNNPLQLTQCPTVSNIGDFTFRGWSTDESSTTTISLPYYAEPQSGDQIMLYAVYGKATNHTYNLLSSPSQLGPGEYVIVGYNGATRYVLKNEAVSNTTPLAYELDALGLSVASGVLSGEGLPQVTWTFSGTSTNEMSIISTANGTKKLYTVNNPSGVRVGNSDHTWKVTEDDRISGRFNLMDNSTSRYLSLYNSQQWRCYLVDAMYNTNSYPSLMLFKKTPLDGPDDLRYTRVFNDENAADDITIVGPSIIPSGSYLNMGEKNISCAIASNFLIEDGAFFIPREGNNGDIYATVEKNVTGYGTNTNVENGWYFLASPVGLVDPEMGSSQSSAMVSGLYDNKTDLTYDLYTFDQDPSDGKDWRNNKAVENFTFGDPNGILYASQDSRTITYTGKLITSCNKELAFSGNGEYTGWNLVGNPFVSNATIDRDYYKLVESGNASVLLPSTPADLIGPMEGIFVQATEANEAFSITPVMTQGNTGNNEALLDIMVVGDRGLMTDRAIVRFGEGPMLGKFTLHDHGTKLYVPQDGKDYAVVRAHNEGEIPVNFKAASNGIYTLNVEVENIDLNYLHLIDNIIGEDIDLLQTPSYTFEASSTNYASRFRLVFSSLCNEDVGDEAFAYFNGSEWDIGNEGEASLQIVDMMGHIVCSETINGNAKISTNGLSVGVYVMRLINGNDVKVQKVMVK